VNLRLARGYFALQAFAVAGWWLALLLRPAWRDAFRPYSAPDATLLAFAPADLLILAVGSGLVAFAAPQLLRWQPAMAWVVAGATVYGALYTLALTIAGAAPVLGALLMSPAAVASILAAFAIDERA
jgi:hypothetical protein